MNIKKSFNVLGLNMSQSLSHSCSGQTLPSLHFSAKPKHGLFIYSLGLSQNTYEESPQIIYAIMLHMYHLYVSISITGPMLILQYSYRILFRIKYKIYLEDIQPQRNYWHISSENWCMKYGCSYSTKSLLIVISMVFSSSVQMGWPGYVSPEYLLTRLTTLKSRSECIWIIIWRCTHLSHPGYCLQLFVIKDCVLAHVVPFRK
jgi:hypothetical protein